MPRSLILLLSVLLLATPALAQYGSSGYGNPALRISETPPFTRADIRIMDSILGLTPEQRELTDALYSDFFERYRAEATDVRLELEALVEEAAITQNSRLITDAGNKKAAAWDTRREELRSGFVDDLRLLMDRNQIRLWPKVERELRRKDHIGDGRIAGESIDLIRLVDAHVDGWADNTELVAELDRYAERMDRAIISRKQFLETEEARDFWNIKNQLPGTALEMVEESLERRDRILRLNTETLDRLKAHLSGDEHEELRSAFYKQSTERMIPASPIALRIEAARSLPTLSADQRERVAGALARYDASALDMQRTLFEALSKTQLEVVPAMFREQIDREAAGEERIPHEALRQPRPLLDEAMQQRLERERAAWEALKPILTRDQLGELPKLDMETVWFPNIQWFDL